MKTRCMLFGAFVVALVAIPAPAEDKEDAKAKKFKFLKVVIDGKETPKKELADMLLTVSPDHEGTVTKGDKVLHKGKAKVDTSKTPHEIEMTVNEGDDKGKVRKGI